MLPKTHRLTRSEFWKVSREGLAVHSALFTVKYLPTALGHSRWAVVTSTKISKQAVVRNHLRRKIYLALSLKSLALSVDGIIFPRPAVVNLTDAQFGTELDQVLSKLPGVA